MSQLSRRSARLLQGGGTSLLAFLGPFLVYLFSMAPDLGSIDSGELAAVCTKLQVAHPTGYPLYSLLGRVATLVLPGATPIARLNLLSCLLTALSALLVFRLFRRMIDLIHPASPSGARDILALGGAWLWAIHPALWGQAVGNEVHALQALLLAALIASVVRHRDGRDLVLASFLVGLMLANHMTTLYLMPSLLGWGLIRAARGKLARSSLVWGAALLCTAMLLYAYLPIRSLRDPLLDWGDPTTPFRLYRHMAGSQYQVWLFASPIAFASNLQNALNEMTTPINLPLLACGLVGALSLWRRNRALFLLLFGGWIIGTLWASGYDIHDLEPYYLTSRLCIASLALTGIAALLPMGSFRGWRVSILVLPVLASVWICESRWTEHSRRGDRFVRLYVETLLNSLPEKTLLFTRHWDMVASPGLYLQQIEGLRTDVTIVDTELLRRSWYFPQLRRTDPELLAPVEGKVRLFLEQLEKFERDKPYDPRLIEERYRAVISGLFEEHRGTRPIYHTPEVECFYADAIGIPEAQAVRVVDRLDLASPVDPLDLEPWIGQREYVSEPVRRTAWGFLLELARGRIGFLQSVGRTEEADRWRAWMEQFRTIQIPFRGAGEGEGQSP